MKKEIFEHYKMECAGNKQICCIDTGPASRDDSGEYSVEAWGRFEKENRHLICYKCSKAPEEE